MFVSRLLFLPLALCLCSPVFARSFNVVISRVKDGDTVELLRPRPFGKPVSIRLLASTSGVDTPEKDGPCIAEREAAGLAKAFTSARVAEAGNKARALGVKTDK